MFKIKRTFDIIGIACLAICLLAVCTQAEVLYSDDFNRGAWDQLVGSTSVGGYAWLDTNTDMNRIVNNTLTVHGPGGYGSTYVQYNLDSKASYTVEFDFKVDPIVGTPPAFYIMPRNTSDSSIWYEWSVQKNADNTLMLCHAGAGVSANAGQAGDWIHVRIDVVGNTATLWFGSLPGNIQTTQAAAGDSVADYFQFGYYWTGDYGSLNWQVDNLTVVSPKTPFVCGDFLHPYPAGDFNHDCYIDFADLAILAEQWQNCTSPDEPCSYNN